MRKLSLLALGTAVILSAANFHASLSKEQKILQALNRLTFGPRPGDAAQVKSAGLKKWLDQQLHPDRIAENPKLE